MRQTQFILACSLLALEALLSGCPSSHSQGDVAGLDQSFVSKNGLLKVHYPAEFAAKTMGTSAVVVAKNLGDGTDEALSFVSIEKPISNDLTEFARVADHGAVEKLNGYSERSKRASVCNGQPGVEIVGNWSSEGKGVKMVRQTCHFLRNGHGYSFAFSVPEKSEAENKPQLQRIVDATEFLL